MESKANKPLSWESKMFIRNTQESTYFRATNRVYLLIQRSGSIKKEIHQIIWLPVLQLLPLTFPHCFLSYYSKSICTGHHTLTSISLKVIFKPSSAQSQNTRLPLLKIYPLVNQIFSKIFLTNSTLIHHNQMIFTVMVKVGYSQFIVGLL